MRLKAFGAALCAAATLVAGVAMTQQATVVRGPVVLDTGSTTIGNVPLAQASSSAKIDISTPTTTEIIPLVANQRILVTNFNVIAGGTGNVTFVYGSGTACATGTTSLTGAYNLTAQAGIVVGTGLGPVLVVPVGKALCVTTSAAVQVSGSVAYVQLPAA